MNFSLHFDYTTVGHVTIDVLHDGTRRPGGSAFYSALQAARLGRRALVLTQGVASEIEQLLEPYGDELELRVLAAPHTTTLLTAGSGAERSQRVLAWAGPMARGFEQLELDTEILHLAPVARECPDGWRTRAGFVGLTPQGLARAWSDHDGQVVHARPGGAAAALARECDAIVLSVQERVSCAGLIDMGVTAGAVVAITAGEHPTTILAVDDETLELEVPTLDERIDDLGAGDVFAAAFFIALSEGSPPVQAARLANAAAAVRMQGMGAAAIGNGAQIEARLHATTAGAGD